MTDSYKTIVVVFIGWVLFRFEDFNEMGAALLGIFGLAGNGFTSLAVQTMFLQNLFLFIFCIIACTSLGKWLHHKLFVMAKRNQTALIIYSVLEAVTPPLLLLLGVIALAGASYNPFLYFQF